jgi:hypothetical protein
MSAGGERLSLEIVLAENIVTRTESDVQAGVAMVCVGDATRSRAVVTQLLARWPHLPISLVDERNTSLQARRRYYEDHPPRGILRLVPRGLLVPKEPLDGYAALLIIERYLAGPSEKAKGDKP